ncbi:uncharacterized protein LOC119588943 [Penaeus monodon]|uniref:uncharacterized protein LOC119588943 n=1 Tax=Penaeus monodon TaxID=6687 RepID=UPI0018A7517D|nr:uncharacterized protein LOC119588943 [Penaeus monodon]
MSVEEPNQDELLTVNETASQQNLKTEPRRSFGAELISFFARRLSNQPTQEVSVEDNVNYTKPIDTTAQGSLADQDISSPRSTSPGLDAKRSPRGSATSIKEPYIETEIDRSSSPGMEADASPRESLLARDTLPRRSISEVEKEISSRASFTGLEKPASPLLEIQDSDSKYDEPHPELLHPRKSIGAEVLDFLVRRLSTQSTSYDVNEEKTLSPIERLSTGLESENLSRGSPTNLDISTSPRSSTAGLEESQTQITESEVLDFLVRRLSNKTLSEEDDAISPNLENEGDTILPQKSLENILDNRASISSSVDEEIINILTSRKLSKDLSSPLETADGPVVEELNVTDQLSPTPSLDEAQAARASPESLLSIPHEPQAEHLQHRKSIGAEILDFLVRRLSSKPPVDHDNHDVEDPSILEPETEVYSSPRASLISPEIRIEVSEYNDVQEVDKSPRGSDASIHSYKSSVDDPENFKTPRQSITDPISAIEIQEEKERDSEWSPRGSTAGLEVQKSPRGSTAGLEVQKSPRGSTAGLEVQKSPRGSTAGLEAQKSPRGSTAGLEVQKSPRGSTAGLEAQKSPRGSTAGLEAQKSPRGSTADLEVQKSPRGSVPTLEAPTSEAAPEVQLRSKSSAPREGAQQNRRSLIKYINDQEDTLPELCSSPESVELIQASDTEDTLDLIGSTTDNESDSDLETVLNITDLDSPDAVGQELEPFRKKSLTSSRTRINVAHSRRGDGYNTDPEPTVAKGKQSSIYIEESPNIIIALYDHIMTILTLPDLSLDEYSITQVSKSKLTESSQQLSRSVSPPAIESQVPRPLSEPDADKTVREPGHEEETLTLTSNTVAGKGRSKWNIMPNVSRLDTTVQEYQRKKSLNEISAVTFCGCGFLGVYLVGAATYLQESAPWLLRGRIGGSSVGSLIATCIVCNIPLQVIRENLLATAKASRSFLLGPLNPAFPIEEPLLKNLLKILPEDAHLRASGRLYLVVNHYKSREELVRAVLCCCFLPGISGFSVPSFHGRRYLDGGMTNNMPLKGPNTLAINAFAGEFDVCPMDNDYQTKWLTTALNQTLEMTMINLRRFFLALVPPNPEELDEFYWQGYEDAKRCLADRV